MSAPSTVLKHTAQVTGHSDADRDCLSLADPRYKASTHVSAQHIGGGRVVSDA